ncbi:two-component system, CitB family, sensor histidine kinase DctS [Evansella caseinilytica]|uniref:histidine kinase n=1 Tax=Evansella caseinilytica TaxID=1503961 RepID=A0A1H3KR96_9BACI|nr:sensor histidine kinase [Evansella caseinilytica]SDY54682.1 two-component system, CitB family, sensor histidine kinase DctS [Evansella caseinilytica]
MFKFRHLPIRWKITLLSLGIVIFSLLIGGIILLGYMANAKKEELSQRTLITAQSVAQQRIVQDEIESDQASPVLQEIAEHTRIINDVDYIIILNMDRIRLTHPLRERIGTNFYGGDEDPAFSEHIYTSIAASDHGKTVRSFVPVINEKSEQVGVVVAGNRLPTHLELLKGIANNGTYVFLFAAIFGMWGSWLLASHIKKQTFHIEPDQLARMLVERTATFNAIHDGVIAIDQDEKITVINQAAKEILQVKGEVTGSKIQNILPDTRLPEVLKLEKPIMQREFYIQNRAILSNRIPIMIQGKTIGAVAIFQDKTEVTRLAQELTGVHAFADALRVQAHEYSNKLHTIAGLIQLDQGKKALNYIFELSEEQSVFSSLITQQIHDDSLAGLLLGKQSRCKELGIKLKFDPASSFINFPEGITIHDLVILCGNLIDNSIEALVETDNQQKQIDFLIKEEEAYLTIQVGDNGEGISAAVQQNIFQRGFSTKAKEGRGIGLFLIRGIIDRMEGMIDINSQLGEGTIFTLQIPMERKAKVGVRNETTDSRFIN